MIRIFSHSGENGVPVYHTLSFITMAATCGYFFIAALSALPNRHYIKQVSAYGPHASPAPLGFSLKLVWLLFTTLWVGGCVVTVVYWALIYPSESRPADGSELLANLCMHGIPLTLLSIDFLLTRWSVLLRHVWAPLLTVCGALGYVALYHHRRGIWIYNFLNWDEHGALWYALTPVAAAGFFVLALLLSVIKRRCSRPFYAPATTVQGGVPGQRGLTVSRGGAYVALDDGLYPASFMPPPPV